MRNTNSRKVQLVRRFNDRFTILPVDSKELSDPTKIKSKVGKPTTDTKAAAEAAALLNDIQEQTTRDE